MDEIRKTYEIQTPGDGIFFSCPRDAEDLAQKALNVCDRLRPLMDSSLGRSHYWRKDFDPFSATAAEVTQLQIARTSALTVDPVIVIFSETIGTPVALPKCEREAMRRRLDAEGFRTIRLLGEPGIATDADFGPNDIPLTGTLFELFDGCLQALPEDPDGNPPVFPHLPKKQVRVIFYGSSDPRTGTFQPGHNRLLIKAERSGSDIDRDRLLRQRTWLERFRVMWGTWRTGLTTETLAEQFGISVDSAEASTDQTFEDMVEATLRGALCLPELDPMNDDLPGLEAVTIDRLMLFGGRDEDLRLLQQHIFAQPTSRRPVIVLAGDSGAGKSSLLRAGLLGAFRRRLEMRRGELYALVAEPEALARQGDPVRVLVDALCGEAGKRLEIHRLRDPLRASLPPRRGIDGPYPAGLPGLAADSVRLAALLDAEPGPDEVLKALAAALPERKCHLVIALDQFEQIDAAIRERQARHEQETGLPEPDPLNRLAPEWARFLDVIAALVGSSNSTRWATDRYSSIGGQGPLAERLTVTVILSVPRAACLSVRWLLDLGVQSDHSVEFDGIDAGVQRQLLQPLISRQALRGVVARSLAAFGFTDTATICDGLAAQAEELIGRSVSVENFVGRTASRDDLKYTAALPLIALTLTQILDVWRRIFDPTTGPGRNLKPQERRRLDQLIDVDQLRIEQAIEVTGEDAYNGWVQAALRPDGAQRMGLLTEQVRLQELQGRFSRVIDRLALLPTGHSPNQPITLIEAPRAVDPVMSQNATLLDLLQQKRLLVSLPGDFARLTHSVLFDHWDRAKRWAVSRRERFELRDELQYRFCKNKVVLDQDRVLPVIDLLVDWPGSGLGRDGELKDYALACVLRACDFTRPISAAEPVARLMLAYVQQGGPAMELVVASVMAKKPDTATLALLLVLLSECGRDEAVGHLLDAGTDPNAVHAETGIFPLVMAAENGHYAVADRLLDAGADPNAANENGTFPLLMAAERGHYAVVVRLLHARADPNAINEANGTSPLLMAAQNGHEAVVDRLLQARADPNAVTEKSGTSPLLIAAYLGHNAVVVRLLDAGADPNAANANNGTFPLLLAAQRGNEAIVDRLLNAGADPNAINEKDGVFPLLRAAQDGKEAVLGRLIDAGADPNSVHAQDGTSPLLLAAQNGHEAAVRCLLDAGADPNAINGKNGISPLLRAAESGHEAVVGQLLAHGANVNAVHAETGVFPLLLAAQNGHEAVVGRLLAARADPNATNENNGAFPLLFAAEDGHEAIVGQLLAHGADVRAVHAETGVSPLMMAAQNGHEAVVGRLMHAGADPNAVNAKSGDFPLCRAAQNGHEAVVGQLLNHGANVNAVHAETGVCPLLLAAQNGHGAVVGRLLHAGADPDAVNEKTATPLLMATQNEHEGVVGLLLAHGADPNAVHAETGAFPLLLAVQNGDVAVAGQLLAHGARTSQTHPCGASLVRVALHGDHVHVADLLIRWLTPLPDFDGPWSPALLNRALNEGLSKLAAAWLDAGVPGNSGGPLFIWPAPWPPQAVQRLAWEALDKSNEGTVGRMVEQVCSALGLVSTAPRVVLSLTPEIACVRVPLDLVASAAAANDAPTVSAVECAELVLYVGPNGVAVANGAGRYILSITRDALVWPDAEAALVYTLLFCATVSGEKGIYLPIIEPDDLPLRRDADPNAIAQARQLICPPVSAPRDEGGWQIELNILHGDVLYRSTLHLCTNGIIDMVEDHPLMAHVPVPATLRPLLWTKQRELERLTEQDDIPITVREVPGMPPLPLVWTPINAEDEDPLNYLVRRLLVEHPELNALRLTKPKAEFTGANFWPGVKFVHASFFIDIAERCWLPARLSWIVARESAMLWMPQLDRSTLDRLLVDVPLHNVIHPNDVSLTWAYIVLAMNPGQNGTRLPLAKTSPLPLLPGAELPPMTLREEDWRHVTFRWRPDGLVVTLPWLTGTALVRGDVLVTPNGIGSTILSEKIIHPDLPVWREVLVGPVRLQWPE